MRKPDTAEYWDDVKRSARNHREKQARKGQRDRDSGSGGSGGSGGGSDSGHDSFYDPPEPPIVDSYR